MMYDSPSAGSLVGPSLGGATILGVTYRQNNWTLYSKSPTKSVDILGRGSSL